jgi:hypothetical protein
MKPVDGGGLEVTCWLPAQVAATAHASIHTQEGASL